MSNPSDAPPSSTDEKLTNPVSQVVQPTVDHQDAKIAAIRESPPSVFVNSEPIREDQVENAVKFLSHPKVTGSPIMYRRSFLERKGLTKEEIDEAFRRVPDPTSTAATFQPVNTTQDGRINSSSNVHQQTPTQITQPSQILPVGSISATGTPSRFHWSYALFAVGFLAASGFGTIVLFKKAVVPRVKSWICKVVLEGEESQIKKIDTKPSVAEEAAAAAKAAAAAAADAARASQEIMVSKGEENKCFEALINLLNVQVQEMKSMSTVIQKLEIGQSSSVNGRITIEEQADQPVQISARQPYANGKTDIDSRSVKSLSPPPPKQPSVAPHPKSYMEILEMIQRGEKPSNIREINDAPPNPNQPLSNPRLVPKPKPWEGNQAQSSSTNTFLAQERISNSSNYEFINKELNGASTVPWWQQNNVRITEIGEGDGQKVGSSVVPGTEKGIRRSWVPPQPPHVAMAEAAAAIRQQNKPSFQKEQLTDDQLLARSLDMTNETKATTVISESGDFVEANVESSSLSLSEIRTGENGSPLEA
ncbi:peroxisomal membrane protein PEX14-like [Henckelia pumila]|uniref:peroxisomal membrane protein PEX14-like n=1 Tax=Henckelia pumila TaxID=405737 RepID=UPI003C6DDCB6